MNIPTVRFNKEDRPEFFRVLSKRVNTYFKENNISKYANWNMKFKTIFMLLLYFTPLCLMLAGIIKSSLLMFCMWIIMGFGMSGIGLSVMHDANHGSYSRNKWVNNALGFVVNFLGGYHRNWRIQHNVLHHSYTNVHDMDEDLAKDSIIRFSPNQKRKPFFRFQAFYAPAIYSIMTLYWCTAKDFQQLLRYKRKDLIKLEGLSFKSALFELICHKVWYIVLTLILPIIFIDLPWWQIVLGFILMHLISGLILALIFQPAHVIEETDFFKVSDKGSLENNWAIHQMRTTANFANNSTFFSWFIGGLNFQIEHHLFPNICHIHYKKISKIVKQTAEEYGVPYHQHRTFIGAIKSHFSLLNDLGTGAYDKALTTAK